MWALLSCLFLLACSSALPDPPVVGSSRVSLSSWRLSSGSLSASVTVPGDLATDVASQFLSGIELLQDENWLTYGHWWWEREWRYETNFTVDKSAGKAHLLVLNGVKNGARVFVNERQVAETTNQFLRYVINVTDVVDTETDAVNMVAIVFPKSVDNSTGIDTEGRYMACDGGWDWAPYSMYFDRTGGARVGTRGIWKSVEIVSYSDLLVESVVPVVYHVVKEPWSPWFFVNITVHYRATSDQALMVLVGNNVHQDKMVLPSSGGQPASVTHMLPTIDISPENLWMPGRRNNTLYNLTLHNVANNDLVYSSRLGFRSVSLVTDQSSKSTSELDSGLFTLRVVCNNESIVLRGANWIPSTVFDGRISGADLRASVAAAAAAGMNVLRVWGGGIYQYEDFYNACDEFGIAIMHDMMLTSSGFSNVIPPPPSNCKSLQDEVVYQVRRLAPHPSIIFYDACNECGIGSEYMQVWPSIVANDISRLVWPSSPSQGWESGVTAEGLPLDFNVALVPRNLTNIYNSTTEHHGPYLHGTGWPYINDLPGKLQLFPPLSPPPLPPAEPVGVNEAGKFISEFGCVAMQSDFSMNATLAPDNRDLHAKVMFQRNYPCDNLIDVYFGAHVTDRPWSMNLYACNMAQMLQMAGQIAVFRAQNIWGIQIWQFNEIWPTGGWGSIETSPGAGPRPLAGQLAGGRWKPLQYALQSYLFADDFLACGSNGQCFMRRDNSMALTPTEFTLSMIDVANRGARHTLATVSNSDIAPFSIKWFCASDVTSSTNCKSWETIASGFGAKANNTMLEVKPSSLRETVYWPLAPPSSMALPKSTVSASWDGTVTVLTATDVAVFVFVSADGCQPTRNNLVLFPGTQERLTWQGACDWVTVKSTLTIQHAQQYVHP